MAAVGAGSSRLSAQERSCGQEPCEHSAVTPRPKLAIKVERLPYNPGRGALRPSGFSVTLDDKSDGQIGREAGKTRNVWTGRNLKRATGAPRSRSRSESSS